ncbi:hypothetical protein DSCO28_49400 [Desulfosarcina ovata subsp. sediminis]|uniref:Uncharacterized protein n=1 Tax=Desulfosarcina ovata subsp. sediminis TaxID=885957 RepID=A0A5K7ZW19_9BACT|nr:hypothetical protein [Desulfosarcina ovata]BBO84374.1 hypothetical protein DSCO28_49400 [Desulfosarcina ovata subsp. sediminis]
MQIENPNPVGSPVHGLESTPKVSEIKREKEEVSEELATKTEETPDYQLTLSDEAKNAVAEMNQPDAVDQHEPVSNLSEDEAAQLAGQAAQQLSQTNMGIANQAIQNAIDLFT